MPVTAPAKADSDSDLRPEDRGPFLTAAVYLALPFARFTTVVLWRRFMKELDSESKVSFKLQGVQAMNGQVRLEPGATPGEALSGPGSYYY